MGHWAIAAMASIIRYFDKLPEGFLKKVALLLSPEMADGGSFSAELSCSCRRLSLADYDLVMQLWDRSSKTRAQMMGEWKDGACGRGGLRKDEVFWEDS